MKKIKISLELFSSVFEPVFKKVEKISKAQRMMIYNIKKAEKDYKIVMKALPEKQEIPALLAGISQAGKVVGLEFLLFQPKAEIKKDFYAEIPVSIQLSLTSSSMKLLLRRKGKRKSRKRNWFTVQRFTVHS
jgi:type IV pilus assembly protein PilO